MPAALLFFFVILQTKLISSDTKKYIVHKEAKLYNHGWKKDVYFI